MVLVFAEATKGEFKKSAFEVVTYGYQTAQAMGTDCVALTLGEVNNAGQLGAYGASKVYNLSDAKLSAFDAQVYTAAIVGAAQQIGAKVVIVAHDSTGKSLLGRLAARLEAGSAPGVNSVPVVEGGSFKVRKPVFSGKAYADVAISSDYKVLSLM
ncbi:MAG: electron transfer flavoprotein subunit alpha/FixB family protein, partial [Bacteroidota bacterium]